MTWPFGELERRAYDLIVCDIPWPFVVRSEKGRGSTPEDHYPTMSLQEIHALPVGALAARDCALFLWTTWPHLRNAIGVLDSWGFQYKTGGDWTKKRAGGQDHLGQGYILRNVTEPFLVAVRGSPRWTARARGKIESVEDLSFDGPLREHSRKPEEFMTLVHEALAVIRRPCELFARQRRSGWDSWGNELDKFEAQP